VNTRARGSDAALKMRLAIGVLFQAGARNFSLRHRVQTGSWAHPASYTMITGGYFPGGKAAGS
jgi:hypothetical protein